MMNEMTHRNNVDIVVGANSSKRYRAGSLTKIHKIEISRGWIENVCRSGFPCACCAGCTACCCFGCGGIGAARCNNIGGGDVARSG